MTTRTIVEIQRGIIIFHCLIWFIFLPLAMQMPHQQTFLLLYSALVLSSNFLFLGAFSLMTGIFLWTYHSDPKLTVFKTGLEGRIFGTLSFVFGLLGMIVFLSSKLLYLR